MMSRHLLQVWLHSEVERAGGIAAASAAWRVPERLLAAVLADPTSPPPRPVLTALGVRRVVMYAHVDEEV